MPGGVPHWVLGTSNAICVGRHFYSASTIRSLVVGVVHTFLLGFSATNEGHQATQTLLYQLLAFWSMQIDKTNVDGGFILTLHGVILIFSIIFRGPHSRHFLGGGIFGHVVP